MPHITLRGQCHADAQTVYDLLADASTHLIWNGEQQAKNFRLLTLVASPGPLLAGSVFISTGTIPMTSRIWRDRSTVTIADSPRSFEFRTDSVIDFHDGSRMEATFLHRYEIEPAKEGCEVVYRMRQISLKNGMWRVRLPVLRQLTWSLALPMSAKPGLSNLLRMAETRYMVRST